MVINILSLGGIRPAPVRRGLFDDRTCRARAAGMAGAGVQRGDCFRRYHLSIAHHYGRAFPVWHNFFRRIYVSDYWADVRFDLSLAAHPIG